MAGLEAHYSARDIEARILAALRAAGLNPERCVAPEALGALDHFHTGGLRASRELMELAHIRAEDRVLDIGAGLAGPARMLASELGCRVDCLELSPDFCTGAALLNRLTGLDDRIEVHEGSALELPFQDHSFDVVWMQNVGMNIADKQQLYEEIHRALKAGGRYAFQEMAAGESATSYFPLPWATDPADSFLVSAEEMRSALAESGFVVRHLRGYQRRSFEQDDCGHRIESADPGSLRRQSPAKSRERAAQSPGGPDPPRQRCFPGEMSKRTAGTPGKLYIRKPATGVGPDVASPVSLRTS